MSGPVNRESSDACSRWRKAALRALSRRHRAEYHPFYASVRAEGYSADQAKGRAMTLLRRKYPGSYAMLYHAVKEADSTARPSGTMLRSLRQSGYGDDEFAGLLDRSSLGTPAARSLIERTSLAEARRIIAMIPQTVDRRAGG